MGGVTEAVLGTVPGKRGVSVRNCSAKATQDFTGVGEDLLNQYVSSWLGKG